MDHRQKESRMEFFELLFCLSTLGGLIVAKEADPPLSLSHYSKNLVKNSTEDLFSRMNSDTLTAKHFRVKRQTSSECLGIKTQSVQEITLWPTGIIPYVISEEYDEYDEYDYRSLIAIEIKKVSEKTCLRMVHKTSETDYVKFEIPQEEECKSPTGRYSGKHSINLSPDKCFGTGTVLHELMHAIGFEHEQSREMRDQYVKINCDNIEGGWSNFNKYKIKYKNRAHYDDSQIPYDYCSVNHYRKDQGAKPDKITMQKLKKSVCSLGAKPELSPMDIRRINTIYQCPPKEYLTVGCEDKAADCPAQAARGGCDDLWSNTRRDCCETCVHECKDRHASCKKWSDSGYCSNSLMRNYLSKHCKKSCQRCL